MSLARVTVGSRSPEIAQVESLSGKFDYRSTSSILALKSLWKGLKGDPTVATEIGWPDSRFLYSSNSSSKELPKNCKRMMS